ncbi:MAG: hypothetical protein HYU39_10780 [Thaumarchaeota archaeon]|nr:hypothetical protein [Nitrososphaerota archaeon]
MNEKEAQLIADKISHEVNTLAELTQIKAMLRLLKDDEKIDIRALKIIDEVISRSINDLLRKCLVSRKDLSFDGINMYEFIVQEDIRSLEPFRAMLRDEYVILDKEEYISVADIKGRRQDGYLIFGTQHSEIMKVNYKD